MEGVLPLWAEYIKALGAPIVALIAAGIAGGIAYRQWRTAQNRLTLDLFDRRLKIYNAADSLITHVVAHGYPSNDQIFGYKGAIQGAHWLLDKPLQQHLMELADRSAEAFDLHHMLEEALRTGKPTDELEKRHWGLRESLSADGEKLDSLFQPFMAIK